MIFPTIHMNGDRPETLLEQYRNAMDAVQAAGEALAKVETNGRNFYPQGSEAMTQAIEEHRARREAIQKVYDDLCALAVHCMDYIDADEERRRERK